MSNKEWGRFLLLVILIFLLNTWTVHHFESKLWQFSFINNGLLVLIAIGGFLLKYIGKGREEKEVKNIVRRIILFLLETPVLAIMICLFLIAGSLVSSITISSSGYDKELKVQLVSEGKTSKNEKFVTLQGPDKVVRFNPLTNPFGRSFCLKVDGFLPYYFDLYPWIGKTIRVTQDLQITPSVLIRIPATMYAKMDGAKLEIRSHGEVIGQLICISGRGSVFAGRDAPIPAQFLDKWKMEILAMGIENLPQTARILLAWQRPLKADLQKPLIPGMRIEATLTLNNIIFCRSEFFVGEEKIQDQLMAMEVSLP